ncbi:MAG: aminotransferase class I/II-fold pyridoxal phosphate-dependent enzyme [Brachymonas sp.]|nr:aminotransferase class I/II-fold pyridoxal phosphate-dependent enzyme [Brachymonas sp.]
MTSPDLPAAIRADVRAMRAYPVAKTTTGLIKLDAMENPFPLPHALQEELGQRLAKVAINRYPGQQTTALKKALATHYGAPASYGVVLGNGSDELITLLATAVLKTAPALMLEQARDGQPRNAPPSIILAPQPSFVMYQMAAQLLGLQFVGVPLKDDFQLDEDAMLQAIAQHRPELVFLAYPNNPTGTQWRTESMQRIIAAVGQNGGMAVVDEAYQPFSSATWLDQVKAHPADNAHVVVMRTMSKLGLAGVRLGYLFATQALADEIDKVRPPYNVSVLNAECALFALEHAATFAEQATTIRAERARIETDLAQHPQLKVYPSQGNMILVRCNGASEQAEQAHAAMLAQGVLVKNVSTMHPMLANCLRLTVGTPDENTAMLAALKSAL